uniref:Chitin binding peritrophin-A domain-containing protein n=1 Tax=Artemia franciscana TaxID=6661 RepID=B0ZBA8_ARTSF|nr:chitin binding peritrophin-A domain-containing protein [Artemia franciscana]
MGYILPDGTDSFLNGGLKTTFSCEGENYGYYADVDNNCQIFHVCQPVVDAEGKSQETAQFSFVCGNLTIFSQETLTCTLAEDALPCSEAPSFYETSNEGFGVVPDDDDE